MSNALSITQYQICYKPSHGENGWVTPDPTPITKQQYEHIQPMLNDYRFITVGELTLNTDQIAKIESVAQPEPMYLLKMNGKTFYTQQEIDDYHQS